MRFFTALLLSVVLVSAATADDRILVKAEVNGRPVRMILDTGAEATALFRRTAKRLGLKIEDPPADLQAPSGSVKAGISEECMLSLGKAAVRTRLRIVDVPSYMELTEDGVLGWGELAGNVFHVLGEQRRVVISDKVPDEAANWLKCELQKDARILGIRIPTEDRDARTVVYIDTGSPSGVALGSQRWRQWSRLHRGAPATLAAFWTPAEGLLVRKELWASELHLGQLVIRNVPVMQCTKTDELFKEHQATLGLFALSRLDMVVDGGNGHAYLRAIQKPTRPYNHNRLGAVFVPKDAESNDLVAHVVEGGPAHTAGIRQGDVLLKIGELDATKWRTDPKVLPLSRFWSRPAGTALTLVLRRAEREFDATVELRDILCPAPQQGPERGRPEK